MVFLQTLEREIGARATRIYAFARVRAFDRGEDEGESLLLMQHFAQQFQLHYLQHCA